MTRAETDRSLLRAFAEAARLILENATPRRAESRYRTHYDVASWQGARIWRLGRRRKVHARNVAHALATAWGL